MGVHLHEFMGIAGVAVFASKLAPAVGIDGPLERHSGFGAVEDAARGNLEILDGAFGFEQFALRCQARDAGKCHTRFSSFIRLYARPPCYKSEMAKVRTAVVQAGSILYDSGATVVK